ncbi:hypothetical protein CHS0354_035774 [Potamilus streckersoni]|uniref:Uncharacterized protein n=1 Tax=Potamilus streckersoni TaxID=2493646 RepID=A0AAE0VM94_9BIVA|nr:hypothetical protein CHS0354_035774 [Potamilus streckersoni]
MLSKSYIAALREKPVPGRTIPDSLQHWAYEAPDAQAFIFLSTDFNKQSVTWKELNERSRDFGKRLIQFGVRSGDIIALSIPNCPEWLYSAFGSVIAGAIPISITFSFADGSDVLAILTKLEKCSTFILDPSPDGRTWDILKTFMNSFSPNGSVKSTKIPSLQRLLLISRPKSNDEILLLDDFLKSDVSEIDFPKIEPEHIAFLIQTSGTTGVPKAVAHTHQSLMSAGLHWASFFTHKDKHYCDRSFGWTGGFPYNILITGETRLTRSKLADKVDAAEFILDIVRREKCTILTALPHVLHSVLSKKGQGDFQLEAIITAGQPLSGHASAVVGSLCRRLTLFYAGTEIFLVSAKVIDEANIDDPYSSGRPQEGVEIKIVNDSDELVPIWFQGEIYVRSSSVFLKYYNDEEKTNSVKRQDGWYKTDDVGFMNEAGEITVLGRKSDMMISGGVNVMPSVIEKILKTNPSVMDVCVVPIPDFVMFQVVCACIIPFTYADKAEIEDSLRKFCEAHLFTVIPKYYVFFDSFPQASTGKIDRKALSIRAQEQLGMN